MAIPSFWDERKLFVFVALIIVSAAATLLEVNAARNGRQSLVDAFASTILTPIEAAISSTVSVIGGEAYALAHAGGLAERNAALAQKVRDLAAGNERLRAAMIENVKLRRLLALRDAQSKPTVSADVVGYAPEAGRKEITLDKGWRDGVHRDAVVVDGSGLVGHVIDEGPHESHVLLVIDPTSSVPAYLERTRAWGIVIGTSLHVKMKYIGQDKHVVAGDMVVTGRGEIYPGGIPIGRVREVDKKDTALYQTTILDTEVDFAALAHVLVLSPQ